ncbi:MULTISPECIES: hypothetical protein [Burkholderia]|uniref:Uncharacterized protein n=2 Tax=Burkholderia cenocepacia TaxID=95486 RepID=A0ABD4UFR2_9BURK|nr:MULTISPECIES: hypothetical protein [Burkholderia]MDP9547291.1 hypothetical protein [Burkholderia cepacia]ELW9527892.1 hypothetical protein [Burkholderia cenocepacia]MBG0862709.1 hypothetical protein [Burkholderia sp. 9779_493]MBG0871177.1 hypothetical protein [Burkholderia sp. 9777_1386]MBG0876397.1 hypothetical protein [Burkholderia sp. 9775_39]
MAGLAGTALIVAEPPRCVKHAAGRPRGANLAFFGETRDNPLARAQRDRFELQTGTRATADYHAADRRIRRDATACDGESSDYRGPATGSHEFEKI